MLTKEEFEKILELMKAREWDYSMYNFEMGYCDTCDENSKNGHEPDCEYLKMMKKVQWAINLHQEIEDADE